MKTLFSKFDASEIATVEFGTCYDIDEAEKFYLVPIDPDVQGALKEMLHATASALMGEGTELEKYEPAEKYGPTERLIAAIDDPAMVRVASIYNAKNIETKPTALESTGSLAFYFAIFGDKQQNKVMAIRRATQFKGVVKARLISLFDETLKLVDRDVFRLDQDFDYVVDGTHVFILRPAGFEFTAGVEEQIAAQAKQMTRDLAKTLPSVAFKKIIDFVAAHRRAGRLVASLKSRSDLPLTSMLKLKRGCKHNKIQLETENGKIWPAKGFEIAFLELLDRRRYVVELIEKEEELYVAASRKGIPKRSGSR